MLGIEGNAEDIAHAIVAGEIPSWRLMAPMFTLHEIPQCKNVAKNGAKRQKVKSQKSKSPL